MHRTVVLLFLVTIAAVADPGPITFNRDVRPILSDKCFSCHGPDAASKKVPLRLDSPTAASAVIVPGDPDKSRLLQRVLHPKPALRMPPPSSGMKLTEAEAATLRTWITQGAQWEKHWAFIPPQPTSSTASIDAFIRAQLSKQGLKPSPEASRETLIRRLSFDLTGLPPTPAEMDAFLNDKSGNAYDKVVDRLLASPHYGERMAVRWLDAARYADTNGYQFDGERFMWRWRDWVIDAFNRNQPYDQFVVEQVAGDLLPNATTAQKVATGFNRNHRANTEDGIIPEEYAVEYVVDRVETTSTLFLGLTMGCARCHNHKYDPLTQRDFYRMFAYFNNVPELGRAMKYGNSPPVTPAPLEHQKVAADALKRDIAYLSTALNKYSYPNENRSKTAWASQSGLVDGKVANFEITDPWTIMARITPATADGSIASRMIDNEKGKGYGVHLDKGRIHVHLTSIYADDAVRVETESAVIEAGRTFQIAVSYDGSVGAAGIRVYVDGKSQKLKVLLDSLYRPFGNAGKKFNQPFRIGEGWGPERRFKGNIADVRVYDRVVPEREILAMADQMNKDAIRWSWLEAEAPAEARKLWAALNEQQRKLEKLERTFPTVMVMQEKPVVKTAHILQRGAYDKPGEAVTRGTPEVLPPMPPDAPNDRLGLARWMVSPENPLTARVAVNRVWQMLFGAGLVRTVEDFGLQGEWPSHPELLDWLATEFVRSGWDTKALIKLIVSSETYRQDSRLTPELLAKDPENRWLARGPRHRLAPEMVRDAALASAGLLTRRIGGPSVKPYQPDGLWKEQSMQDMEYVQSKGEDLYRRSLYTFWKRTIPPPMMINFDAANRETCVVRETRTNTPLQSLNLMNDVTFVEAARVLAQRMIREGGATDPDRLRYGFRLVLSRMPREAELSVLQRSLERHQGYFAGDEARAKKFLAQGDMPVDKTIEPVRLAAMASVASLMFNLDEAVTKQ